MSRALLLATITLAVGCVDDDAGPGDDGDVRWGEAALEFVSENLTGTFDGEWALYGLDATDTAVEQMSWTDVVTAADPRIEDDRALVDVSSAMDGGSWTDVMEFHEGVYIEEDGSMGDYFVDVGGEVTILTETSPDVWEYDDELDAFDYGAMANVTADNLIQGWKHSIKLVTRPGGGEHHDITTTTHVEFDDGTGPRTVEFTSLSGYHDRRD